MYCLYGDLLDGFALLKTCPLTEGIHSDKCVCVCVFKWADEHYRFNKNLPCQDWFLLLPGSSNSPSLSFFVFLAVMRRNPFATEGCCRKGSRNALQELYNPTQVSVCHYMYVEITVKRGDGVLIRIWRQWVHCISSPSSQPVNEILQELIGSWKNMHQWMVQNNARLTY